MLGLRPPGFELQIMCLEGSVISPSSGAQFSLYVHKSGVKPDSFHFITFFETENRFFFYRLLLKNIESHMNHNCRIPFTTYLYRVILSSFGAANLYHSLNHFAPKVVGVQLYNYH